MKLLAFCILLLCIMGLPVFAQPVGLPSATADTLQQPVLTIENKYTAAWQTILNQNKFLNSKGIPLAMPLKFKKQQGIDSFFYLLAGLVLILALLRFFYARYFNTLFRLFFNTSLRQSQLADQLLQSKLPSLFFNAFFFISGGIYIFFLLRHYKIINQSQPWLLLALCTILLAVVYVVKYSSLKFTGWLTGYQQPVNSYVFIVFLICKVLGVILIPFTIIIVFAKANLAAAAALISVLLVVFLVLLRFFRSYGLLQNQLKISPFHFLLYIAGVEVIPLLLIYKGVLILLAKNH